VIYDQFNFQRYYSAFNIVAYVTQRSFTILHQLIN